MSVAEYSGRRYDVLALQGAKPRGEVLLQQQLFSQTSYGEICTGIQKLAQRFIMEFCTITGTMPFDGARGCRFMREFYNGRLRTEGQIRTAFAFSEVEVSRNLRAEEDDTMPDDERYDYAELLRTAILPNLIRIDIGLVSLAGSSRSVILPLPHTV